MEAVEGQRPEDYLGVDERALFSKKIHGFPE
jgi:hypothetical protein